MNLISGSGLKLLKFFHILFAVAWMGTAIGFLAGLALVVPAEPEANFYASLMKLLDDWVLIAGAYGILLTGLIYGFFTSFGFFRQRWITLKWILSICLILAGTFCIGPLIDENAARGDISAFMPHFLENLTSIRLWCLIQNGGLLLILWLSVYRPKLR